MCRRIAGNDADAADATQEALLAIVRGLPRFDGRSALSTWVYRIATNAALDELRRRGRRPRPTDFDEPGNDLSTSDAPELAQSVADRMAIDDALGQLSEAYRLPVVLRDVGGLSYDEIAEVLHLPPGTVRSRIARGRAAMAERLGGNQERPDERHRGRS